MVDQPIHRFACRCNISHQRRRQLRWRLDTPQNERNLSRRVGLEVWLMRFQARACASLSSWGRGGEPRSVPRMISVVTSSSAFYRYFNTGLEFRRRCLPCKVRFRPRYTCPLPSIAAPEGSNENISNGLGWKVEDIGSQQIAPFCEKNPAAVVENART